MTQSNKIREAILFYKKRKSWKGAAHGLFLVLVWWTFDAIFESVKRRSLKPIIGQIKGLLIGYKTRLININDMVK